MTFAHGTPVLPAAGDGPVPVMLASELTLGRGGRGGTEGPLLFIEDGAYFTARARALHLTGSHWGIMNEAGSYPGQPWLWLYTL